MRALVERIIIEGASPASLNRQLQRAYSKCDNLLGVIRIVYLTVAGRTPAS
jgi:hypothetical protein